MKVILSIKDDRELRATIKDMIKGQVKSITREDIKSIVTEAITAKFAASPEIQNRLIQAFLSPKVMDFLKAELVRQIEPSIKVILKEENVDKIVTGILKKKLGLFAK